MIDSDNAYRPVNSPLQQSTATLIHALQELLNAERAGAEIAARSLERFASQLRAASVDETNSTGRGR
jgi:hypothetical protein